MTISKEFILSCSEVAKFDTEGDLELFNYANCTNSTADELKKVRGTVFCGAELVAQSLPYTHEFGSDECADIQDLNGGDQLAPGTLVYKALEGTLIRIFCYEGRWYIATNRKLNAFKSRWGSNRSFGELFREALHRCVLQSEESKEYFEVGDNITEEVCLDVFINCKLSKANQYVFLLTSNAENRIVNCFAAESRVFFVGYFDAQRAFVQDDAEVLKHVPRAEALECSTISEVCAAVEKMDVGKYQGAIVFTPTHHIKVLITQYRDLSSLRGNVSNVKYRYLQIRKDDKRRRDFLQLYPESKHAFHEYERLIENFVHRVYGDYVRRFIRHEAIKVPQDQYFIMIDCHKWHQEDRERNKISVAKVREIVNAKSAFVLNKLIRLEQELSV